MFYFLFKRVIRIALRVYFRKVKIEGLDNIPRESPLLLTSNHQNAFLDALLVGAFIPINLHFLARQDVFTYYTKNILKALKMMPVYRIRDGYSSLRKNNEVFDACTQLFKENGSVLIFPEGNHGEYHYLRPLTKGAPRMALKAQSEMDQALIILPVGINYFDHMGSRSAVLLVFGKPIEVEDYLSIYKDSESKGLITLRDSIARGLKDTLVIPENSDDYEAKSNVIFQVKNERLSFDELRQIGLNREVNPRRNRKRSLARILNPMPFLLIRWVLGNVEDNVFHSSLKFAIGLFAFPLWWATIFTISSIFLGIYIGSLLVLTMIIGLFYSYQEW